MDKAKIIDKIQKCLRLSQSGNANEAASALRQAQRMMRKYGIVETEICLGQVEEATASGDGYYTPPYWSVALSELVAKAFACRAFIAQQVKHPEFRFIGVGANAEVSAYTFTVLFRQLRLARRQYLHESGITDIKERAHRGGVFAQAWLFRIAQTVAEFVSDPVSQSVIDEYVKTNYGATPEWQREPAAVDNRDYEVILSGMRAAAEVRLARPVTNSHDPDALDVAQCSYA